jgi:hypothetical protein
MGTIELLKQEKILQLSFNLLFYGNGATNALSELCAKEIEAMWNASNTAIEFKNDSYLVRFVINGYLKLDLIPEDIVNNTNPKNNYIRIENNTPQHVSFVDGLHGNTGFFKADNLYAGSTTAAHEFGHMLGLDHPLDLDYRGKGAPGIMYPRGTLVDAQYQYNPQAIAGDNTDGGTLNPVHRKVLSSDILQLKLHEYNLERSNAIFGRATKVFHQP